MREIKIKIQHNLTPFYTESMSGMLKASLEAIKMFWNRKTKRTFEYSIGDDKIPEVQYQGDEYVVVIFKDAKYKLTRNGELTRI